MIYQGVRLHDLRQVGVKGNPGKFWLNAKRRKTHFLILSQVLETEGFPRHRNDKCSPTHNVQKLDSLKTVFSFGLHETEQLGRTKKTNDFSRNSLLGMFNMQVSYGSPDAKVTRSAASTAAQYISIFTLASNQPIIQTHWHLSYQNFSSIPKQKYSI